MEISQRALSRLIERALEKVLRARDRKEASRRGGLATAARRRAKAARVPTVDWPTAGFATTRDACRLLGFSKTKIYALIKSGDLPSQKVGRSRKLRWSDLHGYVNGTLASPAPIAEQPADAHDDGKHDGR